LSIIFEDNHVIVVIKPEGLPTQPSEEKTDSLETRIKAHTKGYVASVHRLDAVTGGVMVFAKTSKAAKRLSDQIREGVFQKQYLAVTNGFPKKESDTLVHHLLKSEARKRVEVVPMATEGAKRAELKYQIVKKNVDKCLVSVELVTGRTHQIRVQLSGIGAPIWGDVKYQRTDLKTPVLRTPPFQKGEAPRIALWAHELCFVHPTTEEVMRFVVNPPELEPWEQFDFDRKPKGGRG